MSTFQTIFCKFYFSLDSPGWGEQCGATDVVILSGQKCWHHRSELSCAPLLSHFCMINILLYVICLWISYILAGLRIGFFPSPCVSERSLLHQWQTMETQTTIDDGWDLITDDFFSDFVQPSAKACPLPRPQPVVQPRLQAPFRLNATQLTGTPAPSRSGPCLTVARISAATPKGVPAFAPVRRDLLHHVSRMETPFTRVHRDDYYPKSLVRVSQTGSTGDSAAPHDILGGTALCPSTLQALPCPPLKRMAFQRCPNPSFGPQQPCN